MLRTVAGARLHGIEAAEALPREEVAIEIEPPELVIGLGSPPTGPDAADEPGLTVHSLRELCRRGLDGDLSIVLPLFATGDQVLACTEVGRELRAGAADFLGAGLQRSLAGRLRAERVGLAAAGDDYERRDAMNLIRLGHQGVEALHAGTVTLPVPEPQRSRLRQILAGAARIDDIRDELDALIARIEAAPIRLRCPPAEAVVEQWLIGAYRRHWDEHWRPVGLE